MRMPSSPFKPSLLPFATWVTAALLALPAAAVQTLPNPSALVTCLKLADGAPAMPVYPPEDYAVKTDGRIRVTLTFAGPDQPPVAGIDGAKGSPAMAAAVREHVQHLRMPCLEATQAPATVSREYVFVPNDGRKVVWSKGKEELSDEERARRKAARACLQHQIPNSVPEYPTKSRSNGDIGSVLLRLSFADPAQPPAVEVLEGSPHAALRASAQTWASQLRMPCLSGAPVQLVQLFKFILQGEEGRMRLRDLSLQTFLARTVARDERVYFDFNRMACPFELRLEYLQPAMPNLVGELENQNAERAPFLSWLTTRTFRLPSGYENLLLGAETTLSVPCGALDL